MKRSQNTESGNALWFILLAVALLAALTATISRSTDTAEQSGNIERFRIQASNIMRHAASIRETVNNMRLRGIGENASSFEVSFLSASLYANPNCTDDECLVYGIAGGGASYQVPGTDWLDSDHTSDSHFGEWEFSGANNVEGVGTSKADLVMYVGYLKGNLCAQINAMLGISGATPEDADNFDKTTFQGVFDSTPETIDNVNGEEAGCFKDTGERDYTFYQVLIKR